MARRKVLGCGSPEHGVHRRQFLQGGAASALGVSLGGLSAGYDPLWAQELRRQGKSVILIWLAGGHSQFETFDPKPGRPTGGPFEPIATAVPGVQICELMPKSAAILDRMALIRSLDTGNTVHEQAAYMMVRGRMDDPGVTYPDFGSVIAKELAQRDSAVPDFVSIYTATEGRTRPNPGFLGARYAPLNLHDSLTPPNLSRPDGLSEGEQAAREHLRRYLSEDFLRARQVPAAQGYNSAFARVEGLMKSARLFNLEDEPTSVRDRYGKGEFAQHALIARRLVEAGVPMVKVTRGFWDSHHDNFESHRELVPDLDHVLSTLILDLEERGLLDSTLVFTLAEFGRTPKINKDVGRDHYAAAWSIALAGAGIRRGVCHGRTDADGVEVADGKLSAGDLLATIYAAAGIDHEKQYQFGVRPVPLVPEKSQPCRSVLA